MTKQLILILNYETSFQVSIYKVIHAQINFRKFKEWPAVFRWWNTFFYDTPLWERLLAAFMERSHKVKILVSGCRLGSMINSLVLADGGTEEDVLSCDLAE